MKILVFAICLVTFLQWQAHAQEMPKIYEVPREYVELLLVSDPNSPLRLDDPRFLKYEKGTFEKVYKVSNLTDKSVRSFQIMELNWLTGQEYTWNSKAKDDSTFMPYTSFSTLANERDLQFASFSESVAGNLGLRKHPREIWIIMVTKVELSDGTKYCAKTKYEEIERFVQNLEKSEKMSLPEIDESEARLRRFINKTLLNSR